MNNISAKILLVVLMAFTFIDVYSQVEEGTKEREQNVVVKMKNGDEYKGVIAKSDSATLVLRTDNGDINLIASKVLSIENDDYTGEFEFANPQDTRYFFGPSGIPLKKGEGYYQNILVTTNFVYYGLTDNISIGGGFEFISTVSGTPLWFIVPKAAFPVSEKVHVGAGALITGVIDEGSIALGYGVVTVGDSEANFSIGGGYGIEDGELAENPAIMLAGTYRVGKSIALLTENYVIPNQTYFGVHGIRILSPKNAFDIGVVFIPEISDEIPALPYVGYARKF